MVVFAGGADGLFVCSRLPWFMGGGGGTGVGDLRGGVGERLGGGGTGVGDLRGGVGEHLGGSGGSDGDRLGDGGDAAVSSTPS